MVQFLTRRKDAISPRNFGAVGEARRITGVTTTNASAVVTGPSGSFKPTDVGRPIYISGAGASNTTLITTVATYVSSTQITIQVNATIAQAGSAQAIIGEDDTAAIQAALDYAQSRAKAVYIDGRFITGPLLLKQFASLVGSGRDSARLYLKPGSATVNKYLIKNQANDQTQIAIDSMNLIGLREFQRDNAGNVLKDINGIEYDYTGGSADAQNTIARLIVKEFGKAGIKLVGKGKTHLQDIMLYTNGYGLDIDSPDNIINNVASQALGCAFYLRSNAKGNKFTNCRGYRSGYDPINATAGEYACWYLNQSNNNDFANCQSDESWGSGWYAVDAKRNSFGVCRANDSGCLFPADGLGADNSGQIRAGWQLTGASDDNRFGVCTAGVNSHGTNNYATHAISVEGTSANNIGVIETDKNAGAWLTSKIGRTTSGVGNKLKVDGEGVTKDRYSVAFNAWDITPRLTNGPSLGEIELASNKIMLRTLDFDSTVQEYAQVKVLVPKSWDLGTITAEFNWSHASGTAFGVVWGIRAVAVSDTNAMDVAMGTAQQIADTGGTVNRMYKTAETPAVTIAGTLVPLMEVILEITRLVADAGDTLDADARLHGLRVYFKVNAENDN